MSKDQAHSAVTLSAFVVAAVYCYRRLVETNKTSASTGHFVIGFGFAFIVLGLLADVAPPLGGMMAYLVATGDLLANGKALAGDLTGVLGATSAPAPTTAPAAGQPEQPEQAETANQPLIG